MFNLPNVLTIIRIVAIPFILVLYYLPTGWAHPIAALIFLLACVTDWLDGYLARALNLTTPFGAFLDPVADKVMVCIVLILVVGAPQFQFISINQAVHTIPAAAITIPAAIIVSREIVVSALREWMAEIGQRTSVAVSRLGKVKTAMQMAALTILVFCDGATPAALILIGYVFLYVAAFLTIWSMLVYLRAAWPMMRA